MNVLPDIYICPLRKISAPLVPEGIVKCIHLPNLQRILTEINVVLYFSGKFRIEIRIISSEMQISLLILS